MLGGLRGNRGVGEGVVLVRHHPLVALSPKPERQPKSGVDLRVLLGGLAATKQRVRECDVVTGGDF